MFQFLKENWFKVVLAGCAIIITIMLIIIASGQNDVIDVRVLPQRESNLPKLPF